MRECIEIGEKPDNFRICPEVEGIFKLGLFYICGRDREHRPIFVMKPSKLKKQKIPDELFRRALIVYCQMIRQHCFRDYHVENWTMIIDLAKRSITEFPFKELKLLINTTSLFFGGCLHKMFMLNPSGLFMFTFKIVEKIMDPETRVKIYMLKRGSFGKMFSEGGIDPDQMVQEFGGNKVDPDCNWPPVMLQQEGVEVDYKIEEPKNLETEKNIFKKNMDCTQEDDIKETKESTPIIYPNPGGDISDISNL